MRCQSLSPYFTLDKTCEEEIVSTYSVCDMNCTERNMFSATTVKLSYTVYAFGEYIPFNSVQLTSE